VAAATAHPSVAEILQGSDAARSHVATCASCRALSQLAEPVTSAERASAQVASAELPIVDRALYVDFEELPGGRGGMGRLFRARDTRLGRVVAIKQLHEETDAAAASIRAELRARFEREAKLTARLEHPAIVGVHEAGRWADGEPFYAMRFVDGVPLDEEIAKRAGARERLPLLANVTVVADALAYAHERRIVHRDVKPRNVLVGRFGETVLIDWGLAKDLDEGEERAPRPIGESNAKDGLTQLGVGTPQYMPPEQARGAPADPRMDVYALGATMYHALAGVPPYGAGDSFAIRKRLAAGPPKALGELAPDVPPELQAIVAKAMDRDPARRFPTARELAEELHRYQNGQLLRTHHYTARELLRHWTRKNRTPLRIAAVAAIALVASGAIAVARVVRERNRAAASERDARAALARAQGVTASRLAVDGETCLEALALGVEAVAPSVARGEAPPAEAAQGLLDATTAGPAMRTLGERRGRPSGAAITRGFERIAVGADDGITAVWDLVGLREIARHAGHVLPSRMQFSRDGARLVACGVSDDAEVWSVEGGAAVTLPTGAVVADCGFTPDGLVVTASDAVVVWDAAGREVDRLRLAAPASAMTIADDGRVAVGTLDGAVTVWDPRTHATSRAVAHVAEPNGLGFVGDALLVSLARDGRIVTYAPDPGGVVTRVVDEPHTVFARWFSVSPSGRYVAAAKDVVYARSNLLVVDLQTGATLERPSTWIPSFSEEGAFALAVGDKVATLFDPERWEPMLRFSDSASLTNLLSGDGERAVLLAFLTSELHVWDLRRGAGGGLLLGHTREVTGAWRSPSGARFLTASLDGTARTWDASTGAALARVDAGAPLVGAGWTRDGATIVTAGADGVARAFTAEGAPRARLVASAPLSFVAIDPAGERAATCAIDGSVVVWRLATGEPIARIAPESTAVVAAFSPEGARLLVGYGSGVVRAYDASTGAPVASSPDLDDARPYKRDGVVSLFFTPDGARALVGLANGTSAIVDAATLAPVARLDGRPASAWSSPFAPDGHRVITVTPDAPLRLYDLAVGASTPAPVELRGSQGIVLSAAFSDDGARVYGADARGVVRVWDAAHGALLFTLDARTLGEATAVVPSPDGRHVLVGYGSGSLRLHPVTVGAALDRACGALERLGRASLQCDDTRKSRNANHER
jgi:WD40 repeat protein